MSEKKINTFLYIMLALAIVFYFCINVPFAEPVSNAKDMSGLADSSLCSCGGTQRAHITSYGYIPENEAAHYLTENGAGNDAGDSGRNDAGNGAGDNAGDTVLREDASSVRTEPDTGEKKHNISPKGWHLYIDLDMKQMYVYKNGEMIRTYEVSGGKPNSPSPLGTWKIISKDTWGEGFGGAWLGFNVPWGKYGIHGTTEPWAVGKYNNSKGCIRMRNKDVGELYRLVPHNTLVTIVYENMPFYPMRDGDVGSDVLAVERALKKLGYYHGSEDGIFGSSLKEAVLEFQKDNKLYRTGVVNYSTYEKIMEQEKEYDEKQKQMQMRLEQEQERKQLGHEPE